MRKKSAWSLVFFLPLLFTGPDAASGVQSDFSDNFHRNNYELSLSSGVMFSPIGADRGRHTVDYNLNGLQLGWMVTDLNDAGWLRGNAELVFEAMGGAVYRGRGSYIAGGTVWGRYNFVQPNWRWIPYVQMGLGAEATDMDQRLIGENFNFNLGIAAGVRCFLAKSWALDAVFRYQHISNATIARHDIGINAVGPMLGLSYFF